MATGKNIDKYLKPKMGMGFENKAKRAKGGSKEDGFGKKAKFLNQNKDKTTQNHKTDHQ